MPADDDDDRRYVIPRRLRDDDDDDDDSDVDDDNSDVDDDESDFDDDDDEEEEEEGGERVSKRRRLGDDEKRWWWQEPLFNEMDYEANNLPRLDGFSKAAAFRASPAIASVTTHNTDDASSYEGTGIVLQCTRVGVADDDYLSTIIAPATLFYHLQQPPPPYRIHVHLPGHKQRFKGRLLASDPHFNLAIITINSVTPLQTSVLRGLDDVSSIKLSEHLQLVAAKQPFQLRPHSNLYKILPGTNLLTLMRSGEPPYNLYVHSGVFGTYDLDGHACKELYWVKQGSYRGDRGGAVINFSGQVIGIMFHNSPFLPINLISRWWNHYRSYKEFCRPWLGMEIANLDVAELGFLEELRNKFPDTGTGLVVTKVETDTPAYWCGIRPKDIIVKCDGIVVRSKLEFFGEIWDNVGKSVELTILRVSDGEQLNLSMIIGETTPDKFYRWQFPDCKIYL